MDQDRDRSAENPEYDGESRTKDAHDGDGVFGKLQEAAQDIFGGGHNRNEDAATGEEAAATPDGPTSSWSEDEGNPPKPSDVEDVDREYPK